MSSKSNIIERLKQQFILRQTALQLWNQTCYVLPKHNGKTSIGQTFLKGEIEKKKKKRKRKMSPGRFKALGLKNNAWCKVLPSRCTRVTISSFAGQELGPKGSSRFANSALGNITTMDFLGTVALIGLPEALPSWNLMLMTPLVQHLRAVSSPQLRYCSHGDSMQWPHSHSNSTYKLITWGSVFLHALKSR